jgi:uncharacterized protein YndB with AHSA1/START domain
MLSDLRIFKVIDVNASLSAVWDVLVNPAKITLYYTGAETITNWQVGAEVLFIHQYEGKAFTNKGIVLENIPNHLLSYTYWTFFSNTGDDPENYSVIIFKIETSGNNTKLTFTQSNFRNEAWYKGLQTGWDMVLAKMKDIAEKNPC